jgi:hypothetical protein
MCDHESGSVGFESGCVGLIRSGMNFQKNELIFLSLGEIFSRVQPNGQVGVFPGQVESGLSNRGVHDRI